MKKSLPRELALLTIPVLLLAIFGLVWPHRQTIFPATKPTATPLPSNLTFEKFEIFPISRQQFLKETARITPALAYQTTERQNFAAKIYRGISHKAILTVYYQGVRPQWWGTSIFASKDFKTTTKDDLCWTGDPWLYTFMSGEETVYQPQSGFSGLLPQSGFSGLFSTGGYKYDVKSDRYIATYYVPLAHLPGDDNRVRFLAWVWANQGTDPIALSVWLDKSSPKKVVLKNAGKGKYLGKF